MQWLSSLTTTLQKYQQFNLQTLAIYEREREIRGVTNGVKSRLAGHAGLERRRRGSGWDAGLRSSVDLDQTQNQMGRKTGFLGRTNVFNLLMFCLLVYCSWWRHMGSGQTKTSFFTSWFFGKLKRG